MKKAFTLVELVIVIAILVILTAASTAGYSQYMKDARDSSRLVDAGIIKTNLRARLQKTGMYPMPSSSFAIVYSGGRVAIQGILDEMVSIPELSNVPKDPLVKRFYGYSVTKNQQAYELALTLEDGDSPKAYVDGDYKTVAKNILPSLLLAKTSASDVEIGSGKTWSGSIGSDNRQKFILNGGTSNLLYDMKNSIVADWLTLDVSGLFVLSEGMKIPMNTSYSSCIEIADAGGSIGEGEYQVRTSDGSALTNTGCTGTGFTN